MSYTEKSCPAFVFFLLGELFCSFWGCHLLFPCQNSQYLLFCLSCFALKRRCWRNRHSLSEATQDPADLCHFPTVSFSGTMKPKFINSLFAKRLSHFPDNPHHLFLRLFQFHSVLLEAGELGRHTVISECIMDIYHGRNLKTDLWTRQHTSQCPLFLLFLLALQWDPPLNGLGMSWGKKASFKFLLSAWHCWAWRWIKPESKQPVLHKQHCFEYL